MAFNLFSIKKVIFGSLGYPMLLWRRVCQRVLEVIVPYVLEVFHMYLKLSFRVCPHNEIL